MYLIFLIKIETLSSDLSLVPLMALKKNLIKDSNEYWYMWSITHKAITKKYNIAPSLATNLYDSLSWLIFSSVTLASSYY